MCCKNGYAICPNRNDLRIMRSEKGGAIVLKAEAPEPPFDDLFSYLEAVVPGKIPVLPPDLSALGNNLTVMQILKVAKISAREGWRATLQ